MACTIQDLATTTALDAEALVDRGLVHCTRQGEKAVQFPCLDERGEIVGAVVCVTPPRPSSRGQWDRSKAAPLFGAQTLRDARSRGEIVIAGNEIDALTLQIHGIPALAVSSRITEDQWMDALEGCSRVFVVAMRGCPPEFLATMPVSIRERVHIIELDAHETVNALHAEVGTAWPQVWGQLVSEAIPFEQLDERTRLISQAAALEVCTDLAHAPSILQRFREALMSIGFAGQTKVAELLFLIVVSRVLPRPVSAVGKGPSSAGKSFLVKTVLRFTPSEAYIVLTAMSEKAMVYSDESFRHRVLFIQEADGLGKTANLMVRSLLSEGRIDYSTVMCVDGELKTVRIVREGPTSLIVTTTRVHLHRENETRLFSWTVADSPAQTRAVMEALAHEDDGVPFDFTEWHALQQMLDAGPNRVTLPFGEVLSQLAEAHAVRMRRDFGAVLALIRAHAVLHQQTRGRDEHGQIIATYEDYAAVYDLVADLLADGLEQWVSREIREVVDAVALLHKPYDEDEGGVTLAAIARHLKLDRSSVHRRVTRALDREFLRDIGSGGRGNAKRLIPGEPMAEDAGPVLPPADTLEHLCDCVRTGGHVPDDDGDREGSHEQLMMADETGSIEQRPSASDGPPEEQAQ